VHLHEAGRQVAAARVAGQLVGHGRRGPRRRGARCARTRVGQGLGMASHGALHGTAHCLGQAALLLAHCRALPAGR